MELTKKTILWAENGTIDKPNDSKIEVGWEGVPPEQPPNTFFNWIHNDNDTYTNSLIDANNVVNTELSSIITHAGNVPDLNPGGTGNETKVAIFDSQAIDTSALTDLAVTNDKLFADISLNKVASGTININTVVGVPYERRDLILGTALLELRTEYIDPSPGTHVTRIDNDEADPHIILKSYTGDEGNPDLESSIKIKAGGNGDSDAEIRLQKLLDDIPDQTINHTLTTNGAIYGGTNDPGDDKDIVYRQAAINLDMVNDFSSILNFVSGAAVMTGGGSVDAHGHIVGQKLYTGTGDYISIGIPLTYDILSMSISFTDDLLNRRVDAPVTYRKDADTATGNFWGMSEIKIWCGPSIVVDTAQPVTLRVLYDARNMS